MALVVDGICRYSVVQDYLGQEVINIVDVHIDIEDFESRRSVCYRVAGDILDNWHDHVRPLLVGKLTCLEVRWVDLDSEGGSTGARSTSDNTTWPATGGKPEAGLPGSAVIRIRKNLEGGNRQSRRGEMRLAGLAEGMTEPEDGNRLRAIFMEDLDANLEQFKDGINGSNNGEVTNLAQVHNPKDGEPSSSHISTFTALQIVGTQRRRMPGYGD